MATQTYGPELERELATIVTPIGDMVAAATKTHLVLFEFAHRRMLPLQLQRLEAAVGGELIAGESAIIAQLR